MSAPGPRRRPPYLLWFLLAAMALMVFALVANNDLGETVGIANEDFARAGYLGLLLVFLASALAGRRLNVGALLRAVAGWAAILLVLVGGYAYRDELAGVGGRLLGVLAPGVPVAGRFAGEGDADSVVIARTGDGHFAVRARVEDVPLTFLIDTGASTVTLTADDAEAIGIDVDTLRFSIPIRTANGVIRASPVTIRRLEVGTIERRALAALVAPPGTLRQSLLGMNFLDTLDRYSISGDRLVLTP